jgi:hypothetical protein
MPSKYHRIEVQSVPQNMLLDTKSIVFDILLFDSIFDLNLSNFVYDYDNLRYS